MPKDECENCGISFKYVGEGPICNDCRAESAHDCENAFKTLQKKHNEAMSHISTLEVEMRRLVAERDNAKADMLKECLQYYANWGHKISLFDWMDRREKELRKDVRRS